MISCMYSESLSTCLANLMQTWQGPPHQADLNRKCAGMEPLGKVAAPLHAPRKEDEGPASSKVLPLPAPGRPGIAVSTSGTLSPKAMPGKPARERDRLTFFSSLKRKACGGDQPPADEAVDLHRQVEHLGSLSSSFSKSCEQPAKNYLFCKR